MDIPKSRPDLLAHQPGAGKRRVRVLLKQMEKACAVHEFDLTQLNGGRRDRGGLTGHHRAQSQNLALARNFEDDCLPIFCLH